MKKILGLDLGTTSIGWALVNEADKENETSEIIKLGVRVNPLSTDELTDFEKGNPLSVNADRTLKRGARRNLQRFKQRRENLIEILTQHNFINSETVLTENGENTTFETLRLRAKATTEQIEKEEFARILLTINKKRGYKSSRKAKNEEEGSLIDGMSVAKELYDNELTPGQYVYQLLLENKQYIPDFYRSDLKNEFDLVWNFQKQFYTNILTEELYQKLQGQGQRNSRNLFLAIHQVYTAENKGKRDEVKKQHYKWRSLAINEQLKIEEVAYVLVEINNNLNKSSGYLGAIGDRSKELYFNHVTVGEYLYQQIQKNRHTSLKNQVFYRQDYLDEFEKIWETQARFFTELTPKLKEEIRDVVIFYQRKLKSQKSLISICELEKREITIELNNKTKKKIIGPRVVPKSSPIFQEFKIWQTLNHLEFTPKKKTNVDLFNQKLPEEVLTLEAKQLIFEELNLRGKLKINEVYKLLNLKPKDWKSNYETLEGNNSNEAIYNVLQVISDNEGYGFDWSKKSALEIKEELSATLPLMGIDPKIINFNINDDNFQNQPSYQLWHLLYATEDDDKVSKEDESIYGKNAVNLKKKLHQKFGIPTKYVSLFANIRLQDDYGNLSTKAIRKIVPYLQEGNNYYEAAALAGYNHSKSITKEENLKRELKDQLEPITKNSLRNPVVEKILNQLVNVVNQIMDAHGKPDEIRIELARELKKSAKQRKEMTSNIASATKRNEDIKKKLQQAPFNLKNPTRNDVIKYRLYQELKTRGYKTIYTNQYIKPEQLFSKDIDIEHIIPKAKLFDDSFSNKTLEFRNENRLKSDQTAYDFIANTFSNDLENYKNRVQELLESNEITKGKALKLLMTESKLPEGFIDRDLRNSQYIAKKAKSILHEIVRNVTPTTGTITAKLREDWDLINVMKELNLPKYRALGLTYWEERKENKKVEQIQDWTKRNDHRHHAMDALTVAFTTHNHIQYLNNLNAKSDKSGSIYAIQQLITSKNKEGKRSFTPPIQNFRTTAKEHIDSILISFKNKNKVVTRNINTIKGNKKQETLTPRGQLHKETIYGSSKRDIVKNEKVSGTFTIEKVAAVTKPEYKTLLLKRLNQYNNDPKKAFTGKNTLTKNPIILSNGKELPLTVTTKTYETIYTIRKEVNPDNFKDLKALQKVVDVKIRKLLEQRLKEFGGIAKNAFSNLETNPIWLNKEKGIALKRTTITGVSNAEALHDKKDHLGNKIVDSEGKTQATSFVSTGNNHHVAIYKDEKGKLQEQVISLFDAVTRVNQGEPIINKSFNKDKGWQFLFTLKQNEMFVFPKDDFNPLEIDLLNEKNYSLISPHLFRVQKISTKNYLFTHHLETKATSSDDLKNKKTLASETYHFIQSTEYLRNLVKVRLNHIGQIVQIGEY